MGKSNVQKNIGKIMTNKKHKIYKDNPSGVSNKERDGQLNKNELLAKMSSLKIV